ncbi:MAG: hypothetical protein KDJ77_09165 [Rhodobiaceae bacterium]|nr:hypothetical protein [Rhodobiaceae bacterium]
MAEAARSAGDNLFFFIFPPETGNAPSHSRQNIAAKSSKGNSLISHFRNVMDRWLWITNAMRGRVDRPEAEAAAICENSSNDFRFLPQHSNDGVPDDACGARNAGCPARGKKHPKCGIPTTFP